MTCQERSQYYAAREAYRRKCEDFREELQKYLNSYGISKMQKTNKENTPQIHTTT